MSVLARRVCVSKRDHMQPSSKSMRQRQVAASRTQTQKTTERSEFGPEAERTLGAKRKDRRNDLEGSGANGPRKEAAAAALSVNGVVCTVRTLQPLNASIRKYSHSDTSINEVLSLLIDKRLNAGIVLQWLTSKGFNDKTRLLLLQRKKHLRNALEVRNFINA
jgi:hypothetical protein